MNELWLPIKGYEGLYEVSDLGSVRSLKRRCTNGGLLKQAMGADYLMVNLSRDGVCKTHCVHRLVAEAWLPNPENYPQVNHKKGIKTDNRSSELEWCSVSQNQKHRFEVLNEVPYNRQLTLNDVLIIKNAKRYQGYRIDLAKKFKTSVSVIESIRMGRNYKNFLKQLGE